MLFDFPRYAGYLGEKRNELVSIFDNKTTQFRHRQSDEGEGPYVSFADLMFGIIFLFLIIIAALLILPKRMVDEPTQLSSDTSKALSTSENEVQSLEQQTLDLKAQLAKISQSSALSVPSQQALPDAHRDTTSENQARTEHLMSEVAYLKAQKAAIQSKFDSLEAQDEQSQSEVVTMNSENASLQSQINAADKEEAQLRTQLSHVEAASSSSIVTRIQTVYAAKLFTINQYSCNVLNCSELHYEGTFTLIRTGANSYVMLTVSVPPDIRTSSATNPMSSADLDSIQCTDIFSREQFASDCYTSYYGHKVFSLDRTSPDTYEGEGTQTFNGIAATFHLRWQIIKIYDDSFQ